MRIGLAGVGRIGAFHAATLKAVPDVDTVVVSDAVPGRAREVAAALGVESAESTEALLTAGSGRGRSMHVTWGLEIVDSFVNTRLSAFVSRLSRVTRLQS